VAIAESHVGQVVTAFSFAETRIAHEQAGSFSCFFQRANHSVLPGNVPIMLYSDGSRESTASLMRRSMAATEVTDL